MIIVNSGTSNDIVYYTRYNLVNKYEILDHNTNELFSGTTNILSIDGKIYHTGITYDFTPYQTYTYKSYYVLSGVSYLANHSYMRTFENTDYTRVDNFIKRVKDKNNFKIYGK